MTLTISPPIRIAAICGLLFTVLVFGGLRLLGGGGDSVAEPHVIKHHPFGPGAKATTHKPAAATPTVAPKTHQAAKNATAPKAKKTAAPVKHAVDLAAIKAARDAGLPEPLAQAFGRYSTVVVSLYDPYSQVDGTAFAEAKAGAALAGVGFVPRGSFSCDTRGATDVRSRSSAPSTTATRA